MTVLRISAFVLLLYGGYVGVLYAIQRSMLFPRHFVSVDPSKERDIPGVERIWIESPQGPVEAWYLMRSGAQPSGAKGPAVIFAHGNGEAIDYWRDDLEPYREMGFSVLLPEYRGYGRSAGDPSEAAITEDFVRFYDLLVKREEVDPERIVFHGRSLGGGAVGALARHRIPRALILQSTFTSVRSFARQYFVPSALVADPFDTLGVVEKLTIPILVLHGRRDQVVPFEHGEELARAAANGRFVAYDCDHNDFPPDHLQYWEDVRSFLSAAGVVP